MRKTRSTWGGLPHYLHIYNYFNEYTGPQPMATASLAYAAKRVQELARYFTMDIISYCWRGGQFNLVLRVPGQEPDIATAASRHNAHYANYRYAEMLDPITAPASCLKAAQRIASVGSFMSRLQQDVIDHLRKHSTLSMNCWRWGDRYSAALIGFGQPAAEHPLAQGITPDMVLPLWECVKFVELLPCRAGLVAEPGAYPHSTWGQFCSSGVHPFANNFAKHMRLSLACQPGFAERGVADWADAQVFAEFRQQLASTLAADAKAAAPEPVQPAPQEPPGAKAGLPAEAYWIHGDIIGNERLVRLAASLLPDEPKAMTRKLRSFMAGNLPLAAYGRLRSNWSPRRAD